MHRAAALCAQVRASGCAVRAASAGRVSRAAPLAPAARGVLRALATQAEEGPLVRLEHGPGGVSKLTLCRAKKLNSLSLPMIGELKQRYAELGPGGARCVILAGEGRALCAGGDVAEVQEGVLKGTRYPADFFFREYALDYEIATLYEREKIIQVSMWDGIVMGGGVGLSVHSPFRVATEKTLFAMPETNIGLFPDVGATWALSRLKAGAHIGIYLALTGQRLGAADCLFAGLATHYCPSEKVGQLEANLRQIGARANDLEAVSAAVAAAGGNAVPDASKAVLAPNADAIQRCFGNAATAEEIVARLEAEGSEWAKGTLATIRQRSPTSVKVSLEAIRRHASVTLKEAFVAEYRISQRFMRLQPLSDFCEGIRAVLVDKDNKPKWNPARLEDVSKEHVDGFFTPLGPDHPCGELPL